VTTTQPLATPTTPPLIPPPPPPYPKGFTDNDFFLNNHIAVSHLSNPIMGYGAFATHDIPRHTLILAEAPLLSCNYIDQARQLHESRVHKNQKDDDEFLKRVCNLDPSHIDLLWHMHDQYYEKEIDGSSSSSKKRLWGIIRSNAYHNSDHNYRATLYFAAAKLNHSCRPNVGYEFSNDVMRMYTTRNVKKGEELTSCYSDIVYHEVKRVRVKYLSGRLGFRCACDACGCDSDSSSSSSVVSVRKSDERRRYLRELAMILADSLGVTFLYSEEFAQEVKREIGEQEDEDSCSDFEYETDDDDDDDDDTLYQNDNSGYNKTATNNIRKSIRNTTTQLSKKVRPKTSDLDTVIEYIRLLEKEGIDHDILDCYELAFDLAVFLEARDCMKLYNLHHACLELYELSKGVKHKKTKKFRSKLRKAEYAGLC